MYGGERSHSIRTIRPIKSSHCIAQRERERANGRNRLRGLDINRIYGRFLDKELLDVRGVVCMERTCNYSIIYISLKSISMNLMSSALFMVENRC